MKKYILAFLNRIKLRGESAETIYAINDFNMHYGTFAGVLGVLISVFSLLLVRTDRSRMLSKNLCLLVLLAASVYMLYVSFRWFRQKKHESIFPSTATLFMDMAIMFCEWAIAASSLELWQKVLAGILVAIFCVSFAVVNRIVLASGLIVGFAAFLTPTLGEYQADTRSWFLILLLFFLLFLVGSSRYINFRIDAVRNNYFKDLSLYNDLTGLRNRAAMRLSIDDFIGGQIMAMTLDIDDFKQFNDNCGHQAGDQLLVDFAELVRHCFGPKNAFHFGGDEFIILYPLSMKDEVNTVLKAWTNEEARAHLQVGNLRVTSSCGYVIGTPHSQQELMDMIGEAEQMLHRARHNGKNYIAGKEFDSKHAADENILLRNRLASAAGMDVLTGLMNMHAFREYASELQTRNAFRPGAQLVYIDIENFKGYNRKYGYQSGDDLLRQIALSIKDAFPQTVISRFHDDQFVLISDSATLEETLVHLHESVHAYQPDIRIELKCGLCPMSSEADIGLLFDHARTACQSIKGQPDRIIRHYDAELNAQVERKRYILEHFTEAMEKGYLRPYFQDLTRSISARTCGVEVLARWIDPEYGFIPPSEFVPILESARLIDQLDLFMAEQACRIIREVGSRGIRELPFSINLSKLDFQMRDMFEELERIRKKYDMAPDRIHIEVTESMMAGDASFFTDNLSRFREAGYEIWMDDFGSDYSSLNNLKDYHFDTLKIDMQFMREFSSNRNSRTILASIVDMAKRLHIRTVTEGVETREQYEFLRDIGCDIIQGYFFDKPHEPKQIYEKAALDPGGLETEEERVIYSALGEINLLSADPLDSSIQELSNSVALTFIRRDDLGDRNSFTTLYASPAYNRRMKVLGFDSPDALSKHLLTLPPEATDPFEQMTHDCIADGEVHQCEFHGPYGVMVSRMKHLTGDAVTTPAIYVCVNEWSFLADV
ncbi:MAG: EAL domain-containing protein [Lachnospiraceae bacterium]|nr:EAL domain-containing protein [Lachnospiraceae bacterium]